MNNYTEKKAPKWFALAFWILIGVFIGWQSHGWAKSDAVLQLGGSGGQMDSKVDMDMFWSVWGLLDEEYLRIDNVDNQNRIYGAIQGMVNALADPYTVFMTPEESKAFSQSLNGELEGIGAELTMREDKILIVAPLKDSPAEKAGILPLDEIYSVDGEPIGDMTLWEVIMIIRGEPNTPVVLGIIREGENEGQPIEIEITRAKIHIPSVEYAMQQVNGKNIAHLSMYSFADETYLEFMDTVRKLKLEGMDSMILDLRMNGGGFLNVSIEILSEFFSDEVKGVLVKYSDGTNQITYTKGKGTIPDLPLLVLIDEGSASASEIIAGALQDHKRAVVMGKTSFGKGSVQELIDLMDGSSIRVTVAEWFTPNGRIINETGIDPNISVDQNFETEEDEQLQKALEYLGALE